MRKSLWLLMLLAILALNITGCVGCGGEGEAVCSSGGDGYVDDGWDDDDSWDDDWYDDDDSYDDDWGDDDWGDDDGWSDDDWDDDCYSCGDDWGWYDDAQIATGNHSTDIMGDVAGVESNRLKKASAFYANKFSLSDEQGLKLAKTIQDFKSLQRRDANDLAEFSQKLYGLNPEEIITSVSSAQVGDYSELDSVINKAAKNFETTSQNMREIIKTIHKSALRDNGIEL